MVGESDSTQLRALEDCGFLAYSLLGYKGG